MRVSASMAEQPVKNWTRITRVHMAVPPSWPPALRNISGGGGVSCVRVGWKGFEEERSWDGVRAFCCLSSSRALESQVILGDRKNWGLTGGGEAGRGCDYIGQGGGAEAKCYG